MTRPHNVSPISGKSPVPADSREALQWFVNNYGLYVGSTRGLFLSDWTDDQESTLEASIINLKSRGLNPFVVTGETIYKQADYLWKESRSHTRFGRPLASKLELELTGCDVAVIDTLEAPENARQLWYLFAHILYPRAISGKATIITTPLAYQEFMRYGDSCPDADFCGKTVNWEKISWLIDASMINLELFRLAREESLPPMLKAEYYFYTALKDRGLDPIPQHVLGDYMLDFAIIEKERRLNIECDVISPLAGTEIQRQEAKRNLVMLADGWQVLKFTPGEIRSNRAACAEVTEEVWRTGRRKGSYGRLITGTMDAPVPDLPVDDEVQLAAITHGGGPAAVVGAAGTGKTTCIVQRAAYLISQAINPESILVLSYNADTTKSIKRSLEAVLDKQSMQRLNIFSWNDFCLKVLKENIQATKRKPPLKVENNSQKMIQRLLAKSKKEADPAKLELSADIDEFYIAAVISMYKAHLITPAQAKAEASNYSEELIAKVYQGLEDQLIKANRIDRDDVVSLAVQILLNHPEIRMKYQEQFEFILVDEYQDVTVAQDMLARLLAAPQDNLFIAGDEDETINEAKNACPELFTEISLRLPQARCYTLERNWRSSPIIVDHARLSLFGLTRRRIDKDLVSAWEQSTGTAIIGPHRFPDEREEARWVADEIQLLLDTGRKFGDIAIIYRHHVYANILQEALDNKNVRYQATQPLLNFIPDEEEDMLAFLKLVMDPDGPKARESFERVCQLRTKDVDHKLSATIASFAEANNLSYLKAVEIYSEATADQSCRELEQLVRAIRTMHQDKLPPAETIALIRRTQRLNDYYRSIKVPPGINYEPLKKLGQFEEESRTFKTVAEFVKHVSAQRQGQGDSGASGVHVQSIHDCKGMEFPVVFLVGMAEGIFPADSAMDLEEERRICYVAFTRAKELLYVSVPGSFTGVPLQPSHFLVDARLIAAPPPGYVPPEPQPVPQPMPVQPVAQPAPQSMPVQPVAQPAPQPMPVQPVAQPTPQPMPVQPVAQPTPQPMPVQPVVQPAPQPMPVQPMPQFPATPAAPAMPTAPAVAASMGMEKPAPPVQPQMPPAFDPSAQSVHPFPPQAVAATQTSSFQQQSVAPPAVPPGVPSESFPTEAAGLPPTSARKTRTGRSQAAADAAEEAPMANPPLPVELNKPIPVEDALAESAEMTGAASFGRGAIREEVRALQPYSAEQTRREAIIPALPKPKAGSAQEPAATAPLPAPVSNLLQPPPPVTPVDFGNAFVGALASETSSEKPPVASDRGGQAKPPKTRYEDLDIEEVERLAAQAVPQPMAVQPVAQPVQQPAPVQPAAQPAQQPELSPGHPLCPSCGTGLEANARFCGECGYTLPERVPACVSCFAPLETTAKFCGECGTPVQAGSHGNMHRMQELKDKQQSWMGNMFKRLEG